MRFFVTTGVRLIALPPDPHGSLSCWVHHSNSDITREHLKPDQIWDLEEITEIEARVADPEMFAECLDRPYCDARSMIHFYINRANECVGFDPPAKQVEDYLINECGYHMSGHVSLAIHAIRRYERLEFGILAYDKSEAIYIGEITRSTEFLYEFFQNKIKSEDSVRLWWRYNTLEKNIAPAVFNERLKTLK